ncbi:hypothetical protein A9Q99_23590 [Gammaproteobacteria bacterium 45_16_T64]|nr:hypothetical protein A9Q99_23590 [Gammaproteobacteria bacterium 45_16_T64]
MFWYLNSYRADSFLPTANTLDNIVEFSLFSSVATFCVVLITLLVVRINVNRLFLKKMTEVKDFVQDMAENSSELEQQDLDEIGVIYHSLENMKQNLDITHKSMQKLAYFDKLTGLPNRASLQQELVASLSSAKRKNESFAVIFIDLDNFKEVNDTLGHKVGDLLLIEASKRIKKQLRGSDYIVREQLGELESGESILARLAGDEFTVLVNGIEGPNGASKVAQRILDGLSNPFVFDQREVQLGASLGIAIYPQDGQEAEELLKHADMAMFEAKNGGKNSFEFFTKEMSALAFQRLTMESSIRKALDHQEFILHFHPRVSLEDEGIVGFEALIRWNSPELGFVVPSQFIPIAEESMLICEIGYWVIDNACQHIKYWKENGYPDIRISINLSSMQIYRGDTYNMLKTLITLHDIEGKNIEIEVTESHILEDEDRSIEFLNKLRTLGVTIALDDFGTGYSSLKYLQKLPIDVLKIDRSFIIDMETNDSTKQVLKSIFEIANNLHIITVASGIENRKQLDMVKEFKCNFVQGYYFSKPLPESEAFTYLTTNYSADKFVASSI